jgi:hypothetical protein
MHDLMFSDGIVMRNKASLYLRSGRMQNQGNASRHSLLAVLMEYMAECGVRLTGSVRFFISSRQVTARQDAAP